MIMIFRFNQIYVYSDTGPLLNATLRHAGRALSRIITKYYLALL